MQWTELTYLIRTDLHRYAGSTRPLPFLKHLLLSPGFKYSFWMRLCAYLRGHALLKYSVFYVAWYILMHYTYKYGIAIPFTTSIGCGLQMYHFGGIVVNQEAVIGRNCSLSHDVTIGSTPRGCRKGNPVIGDNVFIGPGAKIIGNVTIGNNVAVGANCVVTKDVPDNGVVAGIPGEIISYAGACEYIRRIDYIEQSPTPI